MSDGPVAVPLGDVVLPGMSTVFECSTQPAARTDAAARAVINENALIIFMVSGGGGRSSSRGALRAYSGTPDRPTESGSCRTQPCRDIHRLRRVDPKARWPRTRR